MSFTINLVTCLSKQDDQLRDFTASCIIEFVDNGNIMTMNNLCNNLHDLSRKYEVESIKVNILSNKKIE